jgi:hypothetical protein
MLRNPAAYRPSSLPSSRTIPHPTSCPLTCPLSSSSFGLATPTEASQPPPLARRAFAPTNPTRAPDQSDPVPLRHAASYPVRRRVGPYRPCDPLQLGYLFGTPLRLDLRPPAAAFLRLGTGRGLPFRFIVFARFAMSPPGDTASTAFLSYPSAVRPNGSTLPSSRQPRPTARSGFQDRREGERSRRGDESPPLDRLPARTACKGSPAAHGVGLARLARVGRLNELQGNCSERDSARAESRPTGETYQR